MWFAKNINIEYTHITENFGSRIDRIYSKDMYGTVKTIKTIHENFSDHSIVIVNIETANIPKTGNFYWKLNTSILEIEDIEDLFKTEWDRIKTSIKEYDNINAWWDRYA